MGGLQMSVGVTVSFDPFEPGFDVWPYGQYGRLRDADPAGWSDLLSGWLLTRYDDVARLLRDPSLSSDLDRANPSPVVDVLRARATAQRPGGDDGRARSAANLMLKQRW